MKKLICDILLLPLWRILDFVIPKNRSYWAFPVHHIKLDQFIENPRAVFENVKSDPGIRKIIFARSKEKHYSIENSSNTDVVDLYSIKGLWLLSRCKVIFVGHSLSMDYSLRWTNNSFSLVKPKMRGRTVVNLWHGIPLKSLGTLANSAVRRRLDRVRFRVRERSHYAGLISSSDIDSYAMATMFYPMKYENVWVTGLPRTDFLVQREEYLPGHLRESLTKINAIKKGKTLIVYAPTYRQTAAVRDSHYYHFSDDEIRELRNMLFKHNAILGFRMHYFRNNGSTFNFEKYIDNRVFFDFGHNQFAEIAPVIRACDMIITDYSSVYIDALCLNKPVFSFAYDLKHYREKQDGLLYDAEIVFPVR